MKKRLLSGVKRKSPGANGAFCYISFALIFYLGFVQRHFMYKVKKETRHAYIKFGRQVFAVVRQSCFGIVPAVVMSNKHPYPVGAPDTHFVVVGPKDFRSLVYAVINPLTRGTVTIAVVCIHIFLHQWTAEVMARYFYNPVVQVILVSCIRL